ncbi:MAG: hypothetical protein WHS90_14100 [Caldilinea sp.]|jgi:hypothetical protein|uniref:hypothetical protein n=1 Tax=Caldilinea sp. TaxID=2293560 RepID=UPI0021DC6494|nr:MAG: hypothetical protein KatS3mg048_2585 [Caldilinea sp.]
MTTIEKRIWMFGKEFNELIHYTTNDLYNSRQSYYIADSVNNLCCYPLQQYRLGVDTP